MGETGYLDLFNLTIMFRGLALYMAGVSEKDTKILLGYNMLMYERCGRNDEDAAYVESYNIVKPSKIQPKKDRDEVISRIKDQAAKKRRLISCTRRGSPHLREEIRQSIWGEVICQP